MATSQNRQHDSEIDDDTQPSVPVSPLGSALPDAGGISAPPRILLWGVIVLFILGAVGAVAGIYIFRNVLKPGQQVRVMNTFPFMEAFLPSRPGPEDTLPTVAPVDDEAVQGLLNLQLPDMGGQATEEATMEVSPTPVLLLTLTPTTEMTPTASPTAPLIPTIVPAVNTPEGIVTQSSANSPGSWPPSAYNTGYRYEQQTWNNCGPANITMALSYYGWQRDQAYAAERLKPDREDKNVSPYELVNFVNQHTDVRALARMGGNLDLLRILIANGFPVVVETGGHMFAGYQWVGHYRTLVGYDDARRQFYIYDSFLGIGENATGVTENYTALDGQWRMFNRTFVVVYHPDREASLLRLLGDHADPVGAAEYAFAVAQAEARASREDAFAWFNMGTSLTELGRYNEAANAFDLAFAGGLPWRMLWYQFGPFEAYYEVGRYDDVLFYVEANLNQNGEYVEETYYWQGCALAAKGQSSQAAASFRNALRHNPLFLPAQEALDALNS